MLIEQNLRELGLTLPPAPKPLASYVPAKQIGNLVFTSGQLPLTQEGLLYPGKVGIEVSLEQAGEAVKLACLNALATVASATGNLDSIVSIVKVGVYVASSVDFTEQHKVANFASELLVKIFGEKGKHTRFAVGVSSLPLNSCVELELIAEVK